MTDAKTENGKQEPASATYHLEINKFNLNLNFTLNSLKSPQYWPTHKISRFAQTSSIRKLVFLLIRY